MIGKSKKSFSRHFPKPSSGKEASLVALKKSKKRPARALYTKSHKTVIHRQPQNLTVKFSEIFFQKELYQNLFKTSSNNKENENRKGKGFGGMSDRKKEIGILNFKEKITPNCRAGAGFVHYYLA